MERTLSLPASVKSRLDELVVSLKAALGADLSAVLVHGSAARGEYKEGESDVDLMIVVERDDIERLAKVGPALQLARFSARIEGMILLKDEVARASDCFPLLYDDIARASVVLHGKSPFADVKVESKHRRLRIEQELREARIRLRRVASDNVDEVSLGRAVERKVKQTRGALWALLALRGEKSGEALGTVLDAVGKAYGIDVGPLRKSREEPRKAYQTLTQLLDKALADVDSREDSP